MLKIKLARFGKKNQPHYRMVITEARSKRDGQYTESIGRYAPSQEPKILEIDVEAYQAWVKKGAQPTETVAALFKRYQSGNPFPPKKNQPSKKSLAKKAAEAEAAAAAKTAEKSEPVAEVESSPAASTEPTDGSEAADTTDQEEKKA